MKKFWGSYVITVVLLLVIAGSLGYSYHLNQQYRASERQRQQTEKTQKKQAMEMKAQNKAIREANEDVQMAHSKQAATDKAHFEKIQADFEAKESAFVTSQGGVPSVATRFKALHVGTAQIAEFENEERTKKIQAQSDAKQLFDQLASLDKKQVAQAKQTLATETTQVTDLTERINNQVTLHTAFNQELDKIVASSDKALQNIKDADGDQEKIRLAFDYDNPHDPVNALKDDVSPTVEEFAAREIGMKINNSDFENYLEREGQ